MRTTSAALGLLWLACGVVGCGAGQTGSPGDGGPTGSGSTSGTSGSSDGGTSGSSSGEGAFPDGLNRPHIVSGNILAYADGDGVAQQVTLKPLPAPGSTFGNDPSGVPNGCALYDARGWVTVGSDCVVDGYDFDGIPVWSRFKICEEPRRDHRRLEPMS